MDSPFEQIDDYTDRLKVYNGWLVRTIMPSYASGGEGGGIHTIFLEDRYHNWDLEGKPNCRKMCPIYDRGNCVRATCVLPYKTG